MADRDDEHLRLLEIFHYVVAGVVGLFSLFPVIHLVVGLSILSGKMDKPSGTPAPAVLGWLFVVFASSAILLGLTFAICLAVAGRCLRARRRYTFCLVMAGLACMFMPFGTVLGVFTILVLLREGVKARFQAARGGATPLEA
jgi:hypothetical protein